MGIDIERDDEPVLSIKMEKDMFKSIYVFFPKLMKIVRLLGLMSIISYMTVILYTWISANFSGFVYFSAGEPVAFIKYPEWMLGFIGIFVAIDMLRKELDSMI